MKQKGTAMQTPATSTPRHLSDIPAMEIVNVSVMGVDQEPVSLYAGVVRAFDAMASYPPHAVEHLNLKTALAQDELVDVAVHDEAARLANNCLEGRWKGTPWRFPKATAAKLLADMSSRAASIKRAGGKDYAEKLRLQAFGLALAYSSPHPAELHLFKSGATCHEAALLSLIVLALEMSTQAAKHGLDRPSAGEATPAEKLKAARSLIYQGIVYTQTQATH